MYCFPCNVATAFDATKTGFDKFVVVRCERFQLEVKEPRPDNGKRNVVKQNSMGKLAGKNQSHSYRVGRKARGSLVNYGDYEKIEKIV